jgi:sialate O-acetylesterase
VRILLLALLAVPPPRGELRLNGLFSDGMVLQREFPCPVWGTADPDAEVAVAIAGQKKKARAGADGRWSVTLDPILSGGPHEMVVDGPARRVVRDVYAGEVWLVAGGSAMEVPLKSSRARATVSDEQASVLRLCRVPRRESAAPERDVACAWKVRDPQATADFSALGYLLGLELLERLKVPVGLIQVTTEDAPAELWMSMAALSRSPAARMIVMDVRRNRENFDAAHTLYYYQALKARQRGRDPGLIPKPSALPPGPCLLYNGMVAPLVPYGLRGALWWPSESYVQDPGLLAALIRGWREEWKQGEFPFGFVQLGGSGKRLEEPEESYRAEFRIEEEKALALPNVGMAVSLDFADPADARPKNHLDLARRLAPWAEGRIAGKEVVVSGPVLESKKSLGDRLVLTFRNTGGGLACPDEKVAGFAVADSLFQSWHWAEARIEGDTLTVWSEKVKWPAEVRYAWADRPRANLYGKDGLPARPFRTDTWPRR